MVASEQDLVGLLAREKLAERDRLEVTQKIDGIDKKVDVMGSQVKSFCELYPELCKKIEKANQAQQVLPPGYINEKEHEKMWEVIKGCDSCLDGHVDKEGVKRKGLRSMLLKGMSEEQLIKIGIEQPEILDKFSKVCQNGKCKLVLKDYKKKAEKKLF